MTRINSMGMRGWMISPDSPFNRMRVGEVASKLEISLHQDILKPK
jgi:hypothetical protein